MVAIDRITNPLIKNIPAGADLSANLHRFVNLSSSAWVAANALGESVLGVQQNAPTAAGQGVDVVATGKTLLVLGGTVAIGDELVTDANARGVAKTLESQYVAAIALQAGVVGDTVEVLLVQKGVTNNKTILSFSIDADQIADGDLLTDMTLGFAGRIIGFQLSVQVAGTGASATTTLQAQIGATPTTGGVLTAALAGVGTLGIVIAATAITGANEFSATDTISIVAASTTAFTAGQFTLHLIVEAT